MVIVLLEYIDILVLVLYYYAGIMFDAFSYLLAIKLKLC